MSHRLNPGRYAVVAAAAILLLSFLAIRQAFANGSEEEKLAPSALIVHGETGPIVVACVGDSITAGVGSSSSAKNYPSLLSLQLGMGFTVDNFGESGATLLKNGDSPYWKRGSFKSSADANPNVVIIMLGTNDSKPWNWNHKLEFAGDYAALVQYYAQMPTHPKIFVCSPPPVPSTGNYGINDPNVLEEIPIVKQVAVQQDVQFIDVHGTMPNDPKYFVDNVHPNDNGYVFLTSAIYMGLTNSPAILPISSTPYSAPIAVTILPPAPDLQIHYTIDGSDPTRRSPVYTQPMILTVPVTVKAEAFDGKKAVGLISATTYSSTKQ